MCATALFDTVFPPAAHTAALLTVGHTQIQWHSENVTELKGLFYTLQVKFCCVKRFSSFFFFVSHEGFLSVNKKYGKAFSGKLLE